MDAETMVLCGLSFVVLGLIPFIPLMEDWVHRRMVKRNRR